MSEPKGRGIRHLSALLAGGLAGSAIALTLQLLWGSSCEAGLFGSGERAPCAGVALLPVLLGALFGAVAADLVWSRRSRATTRRR